MKKITYQIPISDYWKEIKWREYFQNIQAVGLETNWHHILRTVVTDDEMAMVIALRYTIINIEDV